MTDYKVPKHCEDNKVDNYSMEETYKKRLESAGSEGHFMEINLLTLCKLQGDRQLKDFKLAGNLGKAGDFDDVVFRYTDASDRQNVIFVQSKSRENENYKITITDFETGRELPLQKYFQSFKKIQDELNKSKSNDPIFGHNNGTLNCHFVIYTNRHADLKDNAVEVKNPLNFVLGEERGKAFNLKVDKAIELLRHDIEIEQVIKLLIKIQTAECKGLDRDKTFRMYRAFLAQTVLFKDGSGWKYRNDFLEGKFQNGVLKTFRERLFNWYNEKKMGDKQSSNENTIKHMKDCQLKLPTLFENVQPNLNKTLCDEFVNIVFQRTVDKICTITKLSKELAKEVTKIAGNVLVFDEGKGMFKFNTEPLNEEPKEILEYLTRQLNAHNIDQQLYFDIQVKNFPRLSLGFTKID